MVGNDVVDLLDPDSDPATLSAGFDERVFTPAERDQLARVDDPRSERWQLWAAKEAVYKVARRHDASTIFSPVRFRVLLDPPQPSDGPRRARVHHPGGVDAVQVWYDHESVHALAARPADGGLPLVHGVVRLVETDADLAEPDGPSRAARQLARLEIACALGAEQGSIEIRREQRMPVVDRDGRPADVQLSLSHHGALVAWAFRLGDSHAEKMLAS